MKNENYHKNYDYLFKAGFRYRNRPEFKIAEECKQMIEQGLTLNQILEHFNSTRTWKAITCEERIIEFCSKDYKL